MIWRTIGFFKLPEGKNPWMQSHAQLPTAMALGNGPVRVLFATRSVNHVSCIAFADLIIKEDESIKVVNLSTKPVLSPGEPGFFDEHGVFPSCIVPFHGRYYLYFVGWNRGYEAPLFYASIGLAISDDGLNFSRYSIAPLLSRSKWDPCLVTSPHVHVEDDDNWLMTYVSGVKWSRRADGTLQSHYHIKVSTACNPTDWVRNGQVAVDFRPGETNVARPAVVKWDNGRYGMWFCYVRSAIGKYRIGYAESADGRNWVRADHMAGIDVGNDFAKDMICYPCVFRLNEAVYMLYNGDNFGIDGFGIAKLDKGPSEY